MIDINKIQFLIEQKQEILKRLGNPIQLQLWREYRKKLTTLNEMIDNEKKGLNK